MTTKREQRIFGSGLAVGYAMACMVAVILFLIMKPADAAEFLKGDLSAWVGAEHVTHDQDAIQIGVSLEWDKFTIEIGHGIKRTMWRTIGEPEWQIDEWQSGTNSAIRWHPFDTGFVRPHIIWRHASDVTRGKPFNDKTEPTADFLGLGVTLSQDGEPIEIDFEFGYAARECSIFDFKCSAGANTPEIRIAIRVGFWK
jgi:hypothetical protein